ncbi:serine/threonine-protein kinase [Nannocystis sp. bb15-2]|uniref:Serine/threonine-protein kinase n=2 Tax=Nannocystis bainbridge TaxID=2995303 RepID=A0ABT5E8X1_9BACT|nr:serine/threonine-protein kinase [Nannocystis bainbridge]
MDSEPTSSRGFSPPTRDLEGEAMSRRIAWRLFGETSETVTIGRFRVCETLGQGGMGVVYAAEDEQLDRRVALKVIRPEVVAHAPGERGRLLREARALARLSHPNVVQVYEVGEHEEGVFIVMELVPGTTLAHWLVGGSRSLEDILRRFVEAAHGLEAAHRAGIVHRDFKPANALVGEDGRVRIVDFGLARGERLQAPASAPASGSVDWAAPAAVTTGSLAGTPAYMSPEQLSGAACDARSDQFSFCVALYEAVHGERPFTVEEMLERGRAGGGARALPHAAKMPRWLRRLLTTGLAYSPADRYPAMARLIAEIEAALGRRKRTRMFAVAGPAMIAAAVAGNQLRLGPPEVVGCPAPETALVGVWDPARRDALEAAFIALDAPFAAMARERVVKALDDYAGAWTRARADACESSVTPSEQARPRLERRVQCLERARDALGNLVEQLSAPDAGIAAEAEGLVAGLPDPQRCRLSLATAPAPRAAEVAALASRASVLEATKQGRDAVAVSELALQASRRIGDPGAEAESWLAMGRLRNRVLREPYLARRALHTAYDRAARAGRSDLLWQIWSELALVDGFELGDSSGGEMWLEHAYSTVVDAADPAVGATLQAVQAQLLDLQPGRAHEAVVLRRMVIRALEALHPADHPHLVVAREGLASSLGRADSPKERLALRQALCEELRSRYGAEHPWVARCELDLGIDAVEDQRYSEAVAPLEHARAVLSATYGRDSVRVATAELMLAETDRASESLERAERRARWAFAVYTRELPRGHPDRVAALLVLSDIYLASGDVARLLETSRELLRIHDEEQTTVEFDVPGVLTNIGECLCDLNRCHEALPYFARLTVLYSEVPDEEKVLRAFPALGIGRVHLASGSPALAIPFLEEALAIFDANPRARQGMDAAYALAAGRLAEALEQTRGDPRRVRALRRLADSLTEVPG